MSKRRASKASPTPVPTAETETTASPSQQSIELQQTSEQASYTPPQPPSHDQSLAASVTTPSVDTSGLVLVDKAWMQAMEMTVKQLSDTVIQLRSGTPTGQPLSPNGHGKPWYEVLGDLAGKIMEKLPQMGGSSNLEATFAQRYMNLLDTAYGRYIPPITPPNQLPAQVPPAGS